MMSSQCPCFPGDFDICPEEDCHHNMEHFFHVANMDLPLSQAHVGYSQSSDYFSEASSPDSLSRSISSSNVSELGSEDDLTELEDAEMLSTFRSTRGE